MYRHALPPGFVLKKDKKKEEKEEDKISLEELIENEVRLEGGDTHTHSVASSLVTMGVRKIPFVHV